MAKTCPGCGYNPIGPFTDNCPICGESVRGGRGARRNRDDDGPRGGAPGLSPAARWVIGGGLVALFAFMGCCGLGGWRANRGAQDFKQQMAEMRARAEAERQARTVLVPAAQLVQEFERDPAAADQKYKRKCIEVSGTVERNGTDREDETPFLVLHGGDAGVKLRVECFFDSATEDEDTGLRMLKKGEPVTVRGEYSGQVSNVQLRDCVLVK